jgi:integrase
MGHTAKLSQRFVATIGEVEKETFFWDSELKGFHIRARPGAPPSWGVRYIVGGKKLTKSLGPCHELKAEQARLEALEYRRDGRRGQDRASAAKANAEAPTLADLAEEHLKIQKPPKICERYYLDRKQHWKRHILPALGKKKVQDLSRADVEKFHSNYAKQPALANSLLATLSKALSDCTQFKPPWRTDNPAYKIKKFTVQKRETILSITEIGQVLTRLDQRYKSNHSHRFIYPMFKMLLLTGLRLREVANRKWTQINLEKGTLYIPKAKNGKERTVNLPTEAVKLLAGLPRVHDYVFPNSYMTGPFKSPQKHWEAIRSELGLDTVRLHDLRHTVASYAMHDGGLSQREVMELLGHSQMSTTERYLNVHDERKKLISEKASRAILQFGAQ